MNEKNIAFYSPLKPITHETPSGDRLMARLLVDCLKSNGYEVDVASQLRAFLKDPDNRCHKAALYQQADDEIQRLSHHWEQQGAPLLWFCYHPYYKSPDLIGPRMCQRYNIPYVTAEASYSERRSTGIWAPLQESVLATIKQAAVNICFTERDQMGLSQAAPLARFAKLRPFIDTTPFASSRPKEDATRLVTIAMMRAGDKWNSYSKLAAALKRLLHLPWTLSVVGDGALRSQVHDAFIDIPKERLEWHGLLGQAEISALLNRSALYVWPGCGEAYGLAYLEAQAAGLPVVAFDTAGVPEVVDHGNTGLLTPEGDEKSFAQAIAGLLGDSSRLATLSANARQRVQQYHSMDYASIALNDILQRHIRN